MVNATDVVNSQHNNEHLQTNQISCDHETGEYFVYCKVTICVVFWEAKSADSAFTLPVLMVSIAPQSFRVP